MIYHVFTYSTKAGDLAGQWNDAIKAYRDRWGALPGIVHAKKGAPLPGTRITKLSDPSIPPGYWYFEAPA